MDQKRKRSSNWDEEEKQLFKSILKDYSKIIENKSLKNNTNQEKNKAWEEVHRKFNELNSRQRDLNQLKVQWKIMKMNARKDYSTFKKEENKTGGGPRPSTPANFDDTIQIKDLLNPAELLTDYNIYDSDGLAPSLSGVTTSSTCAITSQKESHQQFYQKDLSSSAATNSNIDAITSEDVCIEIMDQQEDVQQRSNPLMIFPDHRYCSETAEDKNTNEYIEKTQAKRIPQKPKNNLLQKKSFKPRQVQNEYVTSMINQSKILKEKEHQRTMQMAEEEHAIKMEIHRERLNCIIIERKILELKQKYEENLLGRN